MSGKIVLLLDCFQVNFPPDSHSKESNAFTTGLKVMVEIKVSSHVPEI
jgi:hypothetical protein